MLSVRNLSKKINFKLPKWSLPERWKGGKVEKMVEFWKIVLEDYKTVVVDVAAESKRKPVKFGIILSSLGLMGYAIKTNPNDFVYDDQLTRATTDLTLLNETIRNPTSTEFVNRIHKFKNEGLLRYFSFGVFSIMWVDNYHFDCSIYGSQCSYLKPKYLTFHERIIDIGFFGEWFLLKRGMVDYDINENELNTLNSNY